MPRQPDCCRATDFMGPAHISQPPCCHKHYLAPQCEHELSTADETASICSTEPSSCSCQLTSSNSKHLLGCNAEVAAAVAAARQRMLHSKAPLARYSPPQRAGLKGSQYPANRGPGSAVDLAMLAQATLKKLQHLSAEEAL